MPLEIFGRFFIPVIASSAKQSHCFFGNPLANPLAAPRVGLSTAIFFGSFGNLSHQKRISVTIPIAENAA